MVDVFAYLKDSELKELETTVENVEKKGDLVVLTLNDSVFYPEGGGQPCDKGVIESKTGKMFVTEVKLVKGQIFHYGKVEGSFEPGQEVACKVDWDRRYKNMIVHTAGHLVDEALYQMGISLDLIHPINASHGKKPYILYTTPEKELPKNLKDDLESKMKQMRSESLSVSTEFVSSKEIAQKARWVPAKLPKDKPLRVVSFGDALGLPDGGTLLKNTSDIPEVTIESIDEVSEGLKIYYAVKDDQKNKTNVSPKSRLNKRFAEIEKALDDVAEDFDSQKSKDYVDMKKKYIGKKGIVTNLLKTIKSQEKDARAGFGRQVNDLKTKVEQKLEQLKATQARQNLGKSLTADYIDVTAPFLPNTSSSEKPHFVPRPGTLHPVTVMGDKALRIFRTMGFHVTESRILDTDRNVFEALNIPPGHPARDLWDTFWTEDGLIPTTHTSSMQNRILAQKQIPIREVIVGRCFRNEATDASHEHTFYQIEGMCVGKGITLADLIGTLTTFFNAFYGKDVKYRIQPSYFPFVEPGLEFMIECMVCGQKG
ncbi:MAG: alanine--tRNA ligase-related protein, partial [Patescibacteria group bacterium]|nr:alanine--tRNA ligase-related protein [Patescibacteria group bacterium]